MRQGKEIVGGVLVLCCAALLAKKIVAYFVPLNKKEENSVLIQKALFFPDDVLACGLEFTLRHGCPHAHCGLSHDALLNYAQFLSTLSSVKYHLDVCLFVISSTTIVDLLVRLYEEGVKIRILTDRDELRQPSSLVTQLIEKGLEVRHNNYYLMHHKFAILDKKLLINGSFNWTLTAANGNNENMIITNDPNLLESFTNEFEKLWDAFNPLSKLLE